ncbi:hypothetical protein [Fodinicola acaciae]|nr:hypothetical protein [Fodinicola acaciae]
MIDRLEELFRVGHQRLVLINVAIVKARLQRAAAPAPDEHESGQ